MIRPSDIVAVRQSMGLGQKEFAEKIGVCKSSMWRWETGDKRPPKHVEILILILALDPTLIDKAMRECGA